MSEKPNQAEVAVAKRRVASAKSQGWDPLPTGTAGQVWHDRTILAQQVAYLEGEVERLRKVLRTCAVKGDIVVYEHAMQALGEPATEKTA